MEEILNYLFEKTLVIPFLTGIIFAVTALITLKFPPKKINYLYGYRTRASMKNQQVWDFSQRFSGIKMFQCGLVLVAVSFINLLLDLNEALQVSIGLSLVIVPCIYLFFATEKAIKKNFPNV
ncbi:MAG: SdpI family protein [Flavobacterium sp.]|nr:SdpI family protein [Flavobacterium sp.]MBP8157234.1 SdpI family protein [Flavobacterium sp.]